MSVSQNQVVNFVKNVSMVRTDSDSKKALKLATMSTLQVLENHNISIASFESLVTAKQGDVYTIAQKSFKRAMHVAYGIANNSFNVDFVPFEITALLINYAQFKGEMSGDLARFCLCRLIELDTAKSNAVKSKNRASKSIGTANAQASSVKGMLRALGATNSAKFSRDTVVDTENAIFKTAIATITKQFKK